MENNNYDDQNKIVVSSSTIRFSLKTSPEGIRATLATILGVEEKDLPDEMLEVAESIESEMQAQKRAILDCIQPFYDALSEENTNQAAQKQQELISIGRFMQLIKEDVRLIKPSERPDFLLQNQEKVVGVELTQLHVQELVRAINPIKQILAFATAKLRNLDPDRKTVINVDINTEAIGPYSKRDHESMADQIALYLFDFLNGRPLADIGYLKVLAVTPSNDLHIALAETYILRQLDLKLLSNAINTKEEKLATYDVVGIDEFWLLILLDGVNSSSSFEINPDRLPKINDSPFAQIFLFDVYSNRVFRHP